MKSKIVLELFIDKNVCGATPQFTGIGKGEKNEKKTT